MLADEWRGRLRWAANDNLRRGGARRGNGDAGARAAIKRPLEDATDIDEAEGGITDRACRWRRRLLGAPANLDEGPPAPGGIGDAGLCAASAIDERVDGRQTDVSELYGPRRLPAFGRRAPASVYSAAAVAGAAVSGPCTAVGSHDDAQPADLLLVPGGGGGRRLRALAGGAGLEGSNALA